MIKVAHYIIRFNKYYISKAHKQAEWCTVLNKEQAHKFTTLASLHEFINDNLALNIDDSRIEIMEVL